MRINFPKNSARKALSLIFWLGMGKAELLADPNDTAPSGGFSPMKTLAPLPSSSAAPQPDAPRQLPVSSLNLSDLVETPRLSAQVKKLLQKGLDLTRQNLSYRYGSDDPGSGGMDCSGTVCYLLGQVGLKDVPRDSSSLYRWVWQTDRFHAVISPSPDTFELSRLQPGDLLFWTGTYAIDRDPPVTHVMIYLGTSRITGRRVMVGASEGRTFNGKPRFGVSVFDFKMPGPTPAPAGNFSGSANERESRFIGYGSIPGLEEAGRPKETTVSVPSRKVGL